MIFDKRHETDGFTAVLNIATLWNLYIANIICAHKMSFQMENCVHNNYKIIHLIKIIVDKIPSYTYVSHNIYRYPEMRSHTKWSSIKLFLWNWINVEIDQNVPAWTLSAHGYRIKTIDPSDHSRNDFQWTKIRDFQRVAIFNFIKIVIKPAVKSLFIWRLIL